jgi:hypothetical protein
MSDSLLFLILSESSINEPETIRIGTNPYTRDQITI